MNGTSTLTQTIDYTFGHTQISQTTKQYDANGSVTSYAVRVFGHDGHGSVRVLTDIAGALVQMFAFDAYGQMVALWNEAGQLIGGGNGQYADAKLAVTNLLYSGEQFDTRIGQQYLRERYYDASTGRFNSLDPFYGNRFDPQSFHKYLYTKGNSINNVDPTGMFGLGDVGTALSISARVISGVSFVLNVKAGVDHFSDFIKTTGSGDSLAGAIHLLLSLAHFGSAALDAIFLAKPPTLPPGAGAIQIGRLMPLMVRAGGGQITGRSFGVLITNAPAVASFVLLELLPAVTRLSVGIYGNLLMASSAAGGVRDGFQEVDDTATDEFRNIGGTATGGQSLSNVPAGTDMIQNGVGLLPK